MELRARGGSVSKSPDENIHASHCRMDHPFSPHSTMYGYVQTSRTAKGHQNERWEQVLEDITGVTDRRMHKCNIGKKEKQKNLR